ncbi:MAG: MnmC family methyltransferase [Candidatus Nezhaarchaeota archaeon]|nr:MnmC family methyltransferase [Candidatus Nezhaarchaeota archaeon]
MDHAVSLLEALRQRRYDYVDVVSRRTVDLLKEYVLTLDQRELWRLIDSTTGGLGYTLEDKEITRLMVYGSYIAWVEVAQEGSKILEVGTGLGRTCHVILSSIRSSLYLTLDSSQEVLAIALHKNPYPQLQRSLWDPCVKICLQDAVEAVNAISDVFDHIIHDGGPSPSKNHRLFSAAFLGRLVKLLRSGGTMSVFGGKDRRWQDKIFNTLNRLGLHVKTEPLPYSPIVVFHCTKGK